MLIYPYETQYPHDNMHQCTCIRDYRNLTTSRNHMTAENYSFTSKHSTRTYVSLPTLQTMSPNKIKPFLTDTAPKSTPWHQTITIPHTKQDNGQYIALAHFSAPHQHENAT